MLARPGLELRDVESIREHYAWTVRAWADTLEQRWDEVVGLIGRAGRADLAALPGRWRR